MSFLIRTEYSRSWSMFASPLDLTERESLQQAFELICKMLTPPLPTTGDTEESKSVVLRGAMKHSRNVGMCVSLVKDDNGIPKCFCVALVKSPLSQAETKISIPIAFDQIVASAASGQVTTEGAESYEGLPKSSLSSFSAAFTTTG